MKEKNERIPIVPSKWLAAGFTMFIALSPYHWLMRLFSVTDRILVSHIGISAAIRLMPVTRWILEDCSFRLSY